MPTRVLLVASRPDRGRALRRLTRLSAAAWREDGASVHVLEPGGRFRSALRQAVSEADLVHVIDARDAAALAEGTGGALLAVHCHDLADLLEDLGHEPERGRRAHPLRRRQARQVVQALVRADRILATSRYTAEQVSRLTEREAEVLLAPVDPALTEQSGRLDAWTPPAWPYLLTVGGPGRRDRRDAAILAWSRLRRTQRLDGASLVVVGPPLTDHEDGLVTACGGHVTVLSDVTDTQLATLYRCSLALVALGRPTGFVWPIAEAHQAGRAVLATDHPVFEESGQSGCVYLPVEGLERFDAGTWTSIAEDLTARVVGDRGAVNAERFTWRGFVDRLPMAAGVSAPAIDLTSLPEPLAVVKAHSDRQATAGTAPATAMAPTASTPAGVSQPTRSARPPRSASASQSVAPEMITAATRHDPWMPEVITLPASSTQAGAPDAHTGSAGDRAHRDDITDGRAEPTAQERVPLAAKR